MQAAIRSLRRTPGFAVTAVLTLALGIGLSVEVFTVAEALLLRKLPFRDQDRLMVLWGQGADRSSAHWPLELATAREFARATRTSSLSPSPPTRAPGPSRSATATGSSA